MTTKNYGLGVSGYLDVDMRAWETAVIQAGKPVVDKDLNTRSDIAAALARGLGLYQNTSGWLDTDAITSSLYHKSLFQASAVPNELQVKDMLVACVNGWSVRVQHTNRLNTNTVDLGSAPVGAGARRTDIVILEVWRRLISAEPSPVGKSTLGRIWRYGNVKVPGASDAALNFADDLKDATVGAETALRVQIQYRLRVVRDVDLITYPQGINDPNVVARTVPPNAATPDGNAYGGANPTYTNLWSEGDSGLWRAGDGDPANGLGTVDGYMYALPLVGVIRRNSTAFDRDANQNGAGASGGASGRPDGLFHDTITARDIVDLRNVVNPAGWDLHEVLEKSTRLLFDNALANSISLVNHGNGVHGHTVLWANEAGPADTPGATRIGEFDAVRRRFSDEPTYEVMTVQVGPSGANWADDEVVTLDLTNLAVYPYPAFNWAAKAASITGDFTLIDVVRAHFIGGVGKVTRTANVKKVDNLGAKPPQNLQVTLGSVVAEGITNEPLLVDILVAYPAGSGLSKTPTADYSAASYVLETPAQLPAAPPYDFHQLSNLSFDYTHRAVNAQYLTTDVVLTMRATSDLNPCPYIVLPERANVAAVTKNGVVVNVTLDASGRIATFTNPADATVPGDALVIAYRALRPIPANDIQMTFWYETRMPQTVARGLLPNTLDLNPRVVSPHLYTITAGSASEGEGFPFPYAYVQTGGIYTGLAVTPAFTGDHNLRGSAEVQIADFNAEVGMLRLPAFVGFEPTDPISLSRAALDPDDAEGRSYYKAVAPGTYLPSAYAQNLSDPRAHKVVLPILAELRENTSFGQAGQLVLALVTRWANLDQFNNVVMNPVLNDNTTSVSVFRIPGNLMTRSI